MNSLPALFLSHGAPDLPIQDGVATEFMRSLRQHFPRPKAILVISAHWCSAQPQVSLARQPKTIHDFSGFPVALYELNYPALGAPALAERVMELLAIAHLSCSSHPSRGLDHGAWIPLLLAYPEADIPVTQLSIQPDRDPQYHWQLGQAIAPLRQEGVLVIGSGSITHNLGALSADYDAKPFDWVQRFDRWIAQTIEQGNWDTLMHYRRLAPNAIDNHPTDEHLLPLFVALGAGGTPVMGHQLHGSYTYGALSMAAYSVW
jgi:4,5-DOPA dioxygenase extradiol